MLFQHDAAVKDNYRQKGRASSKRSSIRVSACGVLCERTRPVHGEGTRWIGPVSSQAKDSTLDLCWLGEGQRVIDREPAGQNLFAAGGPVHFDAINARRVPQTEI